jgi:hypothetical protein
VLVYVCVDMYACDAVRVCWHVHVCVRVYVCDALCDSASMLYLERGFSITAPSFGDFVERLVVFMSVGVYVRVGMHVCVLVWRLRACVMACMCVDMYVCDGMYDSASMLYLEGEFSITAPSFGDFVERCDGVYVCWHVCACWCVCLMFDGMYMCVGVHACVLQCVCCNVFVDVYVCRRACV